MNPFLDSLLPYPFERMNALKTGLTSRSNAPHIALSIGEPKHAAAPFLVDAATDANFVRPGLGTYPATRGSESLRNAISAWAASRFRLKAGSLTPGKHVLPVMDAVAPPPIAEAPPPPPMAMAPAVTGGGIGALPLLIGLAAIVAIAAVVLKHSDSDGEINLPISP